jgi:hypothetical protein
MFHDVWCLQVKAAFPKVDWQPASLLKVRLTTVGPSHQAAYAGKADPLQVQIVQYHQQHQASSSAQRTG